MIILFGIGCQTSQAEDIQVFTHSLSGGIKADENGKLHGLPNGGRRAIDVEIVNKLMEKLNLDYTIQETIFSRGFRAIQTEEKTILFNVLRTPAREQTVKWVGPLQEYVSYLYDLKSNPTSVQNLEQAKRVGKICVLIGSVHYITLTSQGFQNLVGADTYAECYELLSQKKVDLIVSNSSSFELDRQSKLYEFRQTPIKVSIQEGYIAFSTDFSNEDADKWQNALDEIKRSGEFGEIVNKFRLLNDIE